MSKIHFSAVAIAAMSVVSGGVQAQSVITAASGASALRTTTLNAYAATCAGGAGTAQHFAATTAEGGTNVRAIRCGGANGKVFSLDTDGGSWRAYAVQELATIQAQAVALGVQPIRYLDLSVCPAAVGGTLAAPTTCGAGTAAKVIGAAPANTALVTAPTRVTFGFTDVNPAFFDGVAGVNLGEDQNRPAGYVGWKGFDPALTNSRPALNVVFGVAASRQLITEMMEDQGITAAARPECYNDTTPPGGTRTVANLAPAAAEACAPVITKDQYRSLTTASFNQLNGSYRSLFRNAAPAAAAGATVEIERRDFGSGTQAAANQYFHGVGCTPFSLVPSNAFDSDGVSYNVTENNASGDVVNRLSAAGARRVGVLSRESTPTATGGWGFLKLATGAERGAIATTGANSLNGGYPDTAAASRGYYDFWATAWIHTNDLNPPAGSDTAAILAALPNIASSDAVFRLTPIATPTDNTGTGNPAGAYYSKTGMSGACVGAVSN